MTIIERIESILAERGMKKKAAYEAIGVSASTYSTWVAMNVVSIPSEYIPELARLFGITCDELLTGETQIISDEGTRHLIAAFRDLPWDSQQLVLARVVEEQRYQQGQAERLATLARARA